MGTLLRYPYEVRDEKEYFDEIQDVKVTKDMLDLAKHIVTQKAVTFEPAKFEDHYEEALTELINAKRNGKTVGQKPRPRGENVVGLMDAPKKSLATEATTTKGKKPRKARPVRRKCCCQSKESAAQRRRRQSPCGHGTKKSWVTVFRSHAHPDTWLVAVCPRVCGRRVGISQLFQIVRARDLGAAARDWILRLVCFDICVRLRAPSERGAWGLVPRARPRAGPSFDVPTPSPGVRSEHLRRERSRPRSAPDESAFADLVASLPRRRVAPAISRPPA